MIFQIQLPFYQSHSWVLLHPYPASWKSENADIVGRCLIKLSKLVQFFPSSHDKCLDAFPRSPCATLCQPLCALRASEDHPTWLNIYLLAHIYVPTRNALEILVSFKLCTMIGTASSMPILLESYDLLPTKCTLSLDNLYFHRTQVRYLRCLVSQFVSNSVIFCKPS